MSLTGSTTTSRVQFMGNLRSRGLGPVPSTTESALPLESLWVFRPFRSDPTRCSGETLVGRGYRPKAAALGVESGDMRVAGRVGSPEPAVGRARSRPGALALELHGIVRAEQPNLVALRAGELTQSLLVGGSHPVVLGHQLLENGQARRAVGRVLDLPVVEVGVAAMQQPTICVAYRDRAVAA